MVTYVSDMGWILPEMDDVSNRQPLEVEENMGKALMDTGEGDHKKAGIGVVLPGCRAVNNYFRIGYVGGEPPHQ